MPTVAEIKAAARKLPVKHRTDLLEDFAQDPAIQKEQLARLRAAVEEGMRDHAEGRYIEINSAAEHRAFFDDIKRRGRARLNARLKKSA
jgi:hypothetical protein